MSLDAQVLRGVDLTDRLEQCPVLDSAVVFKGVVWDVRRDTVDLGEAGTVRREYVDHPGAVSIVALRQVAGRDQVLLIQQYRHPVGAFAVSYTHLRAHETRHDLVCRLLL